MRIVLDANIYVSALISDKGNPGRIVQKWLQGDFDVLISPEILDELLRVTEYERIQKKYARVKESRLEFIELISRQGILVEPAERLSVIADDESDNRYLESAVAGGAQYIISGDAHLLKLGEYQGILILSPAVFLALLEMEGL